MFQDRRGLKSSAASSENRLKPVVLRTHFSGFSRGVAQEFIPGQWFSDLQNLGGAVEQCSPRVRIFLCGQTRVGVWSLRSLVSATFTSGSPVAEKWNGDEAKSVARTSAREFGAWGGNFAVRKGALRVGVVVRRVKPGSCRLAPGVLVFRYRQGRFPVANLSGKREEIRGSGEMVGIGRP